MPLNQSIEQFIDSLDPTVIDTLVASLIEGRENCVGDSCLQCRLRKKLEQANHLICDPSELTLKLLFNVVDPNSLLLVGFLLAIHLVEVKELEALNAH